MCVVVVRNVGERGDGGMGCGGWEGKWRLLLVGGVVGTEVLHLFGL